MGQLLHLHRPGRIAWVWRLWRDDFKEENVSRGKKGTGKGGQFVSKGEGGGAAKSEAPAEKEAPKGPVGYEVSSKASSLLKQHGYLKQKGAPSYQHASGAMVHFHPPEKEGAKVSFAWSHHPVGGAPSVSGHGLAGLHNLLSGGKAEMTASQAAAAGVKHKGEEPAAPAPAGPISGSHIKAVESQGFHEVSKGDKAGIWKDPGSGAFVVLHTPTDPSDPMATTQWQVFSKEGWAKGESTDGTGMVSMLGAIQKAKKPAEAPKPAPPLTEHGVSAALAKGLKTAGFGSEGPHPEFGGEVFVNKEGVKVHLENPKDPAKPAEGGWYVEGPDDPENGVFGYGSAALGEAINEAHKKAAGQTEPKVTAPKGIEEVLPTQHTSTNSSWGGGDLTIHEKLDSHGDPIEQVTIGQNGKWKIWNTAQGTVAEGTGQESLNAEFEKLHPRGPGGKFMAGPGGGEPAPPPEPPIGPEIDPAKLNKVGPQLGSNPGFQGEDENGNKFYVKQSKSPDHAKNELLAAALYNAAGSPILKYHPLPDGKGIATQWQEPDKPGGAANFTPAEKKAAQAEFATHAWLANWDAVGLQNDNQQIIGGKPHTVDLGGSLLYRAQGAPKGMLFGNQVGEWDSLRKGTKNPTATKLYGPMTDQQLKDSVQKIAGISDDQIRDLVHEHGPGSFGEKDKLAQTLIARRNDLVQKAKDLDKPKPPPPPPAPPDPHTLRAKIAGWNPPGKPQAAVDHYKGNGYDPMNALCRFFDMQPNDPSIEAQHIREITAWLDKASSKEPVTLYRGIKGDYARQVRAVGSLPGGPGRLLSDDGFVSMSASKQFADAWHHGTGLTLKITVPAGTKMATVRPANSSDGEYEAIAQRGTQFRITKWDTYAQAYEVELVQSHLKP